MDAQENRPFSGEFFRKATATTSCIARIRGSRQSPHSDTAETKKLPERTGPRGAEDAVRFRERDGLCRGTIEPRDLVRPTHARRISVYEACRQPPCRRAIASRPAERGCLSRCGPIQRIRFAHIDGRQGARRCAGRRIGESPARVKTGFTRVLGVNTRVSGRSPWRQAGVHAPLDWLLSQAASTAFANATSGPKCPATIVSRSACWLAKRLACS